MSNYRIKLFLENITHWADTQQISKNTNAVSQLCYISYRVGKLSKQVLVKNSTIDLELEIGKLIVAIIVLCQCKGISLDSCLEVVYNSLRFCEGKLVNGIYSRNKS